MGQAIPIMPKFGSAPPLFLEDEDIFQKSATMVEILLQFRLEPREPIFELHLLKKKNFPRRDSRSDR